MMRSWAQRSPIVAGASVIVDALLSADFGIAPQFSRQSTVSRIVFGVPRLRHTAETALGKYAADAADEYKTSSVEFVWRQCAPLAWTWSLPGGCLTFNISSLCVVQTCCSTVLFYCCTWLVLRLV